MDERLLNDLLECSVCLDRLDTSSKVLPCQHTFCKKCLEEIVLTKSELRCPECRVLVSVSVDELPPNVLLMRILEGMKHVGVLTGTPARGINKKRPAPRTPPAATLSPNSTTGGAEQKSNSPNSLSNAIPNLPYARAMFDYNSKEPGVLCLKKGDVVSHLKKIDQQWCQGQCQGKTGIFPFSCVQVIAPVQQNQVASCRALYDFRVSCVDDDSCLSFRKDDVIAVIRRVDENWAEGKLNDRIGIFPLAFVEMNSIARALMKLSVNSQPGPSRVAPPTPTSDDTTPLIATELTSPSNTASAAAAAATTTTTTTTAATTTTTTTTTTTAPVRNNIANMITSTPRPGANATMVENVPGNNSDSSSMTSTPNSISSSGGGGGTSSSSSSTTPSSPISPPAAAAASSVVRNSLSPPPPQQKQQQIAQLSRPPMLILPTSHITVTQQQQQQKQVEKRHSLVIMSNQANNSIDSNRHSAEILGNIDVTNDQTSSGTSSNSVLRHRRSGSDINPVQLPAPYVALYPYKPQKADELELKKGGVYLVTERCQDGWFKGTSNRTLKSGVFPGNYVTLAKPLLTIGQSRVTSSSPRDLSSPPPSSVTATTNVSSLRTATNTVAPSFRSLLPAPELPPRGANQGQKPTTATQINWSPSERTHDGQSNWQPMTPAASSSISSLTPVNQSPNTSTCQSPIPSKSAEKTKDKKEKCGLMKRLASMKRSKSPPTGSASYSMDNPVFDDSPVTTPAHTPQHVHSRSGSCPSQLLHLASSFGHQKALQSGSLSARSSSRHKDRPTITTHFAHVPLRRDENSSGVAHRKSNSLDAGEARKPKQLAPSVRERFRCIFPYPPNSEYELELQVGDIIYVHRKREDGWYRGTQQRTGKTGLFPASFVETY